MFIRSFLLICLFSGCCRCPYPTCCTYESEEPILIAYEEAEAEGVIVDEAPREDAWWQVFHDEQLEELMSHALAMNPKISSLGSQVREAYGEVRIAKSRLYPRIDLLDNFQFEQQTRTGQFPIFPNLPFEFGLWTLQLNLYYDIDLWNKNKDRFQKYVGKQRAAMLDYDWGAFVLCLSVAENYFKWLIRSEMVEIQQKVVEKQTVLYELILKMINHNLANALDYIAQKVNIERAKEDLSSLILEKELYEHALKALVGNFCESLIEVPVEMEGLLPFSLPKCLTLDLLARRPDIQSQIWLIESARKEIDIARKEFYPDLDLTAFWGFSTIQIQKLFSTASTNWLIAPALHLPIFHGGELSGNLLIAKEEYTQEISIYNQMVLDATQDVLDALSNLKANEAIYGRNQEEIQLVQEDISLQKARITHNLDPITLLIQKEIGLLSIELREKQVQEQILGTILNLIRATGG